MYTGLKKKKKLVHKAGEFIGNQIVDTVTKSNGDNIEKQEPVKEIKKRWIIKMRRVFIIKNGTV